MCRHLSDGTIPEVRLKVGMNPANCYKTNTRNEIKSQSFELFIKLRLAQEQIKYIIISELSVVCCGPAIRVPTFVVGAYTTPNVFPNAWYNFIQDARTNQ